MTAARFADPSAIFECFVACPASRARASGPRSRRLDDPKLPTRAQIDDALARAADESFLAVEYRPIVRPLLRIPRDRWPTCCGGGCEPCSTTLVRVADRTLEILGRRDPLPDDESA